MGLFEHGDQRPALDNIETSAPDSQIWMIIHVLSKRQMNGDGWMERLGEAKSNAAAE